MKRIDIVETGNYGGANIVESGAQVDRVHIILIEKSGGKNEPVGVGVICTSVTGVVGC